MLPRESMFVAWQSNKSQTPKVIELVVFLQPDDPTGQTQDIEPFFILFIWIRYS